MFSGSERRAAFLSGLAQVKNGISRIRGGTVLCLNASSRCKQQPAANTEPSAR